MIMFHNTNKISAYVSKISEKGVGVREKMEKIRLALFEKKLVTMKDALTRSEKKIAEYICENPEEFTKLATTELSENIHTSIAAITRFTKKMGYDKLQDLKLDITRDLEATVNYKSKKQYENIQKSDDALDVAKKVIQENIDSIIDIEKMLKLEDLNETLNIMRRARRLIFVGLGGSASVAQDAYHKFMRLGLMVELVTDVHVQGIVSAVGNSQDAIIVVSHEGANADLNRALKIAKENKMKIIAITQFVQSPLVKLADVSLYTLSGEFSYKPEPLISRIAEYSLIDVLYVNYCTQSQEKLEEKLIKISETIKQFKNYTD